MNDLRTAAQQALEALENAEDQLAKPYSTDASKAVVALRAALAQQAEPVQEPEGMVEFLADLQRSRTKYPKNRRMFDGLMGEIDELRRAYAGDGDIRAEAFDVAVCAFRIATEGDAGGNARLEQAEPVEPRRWEGDHNVESPFNACMHKSYCITLKQALAQQAEPMGAVLVNRESREGVMFYSVDMIPDPATLKDRFELVKVYTAPPQRKPLTDEEIERLWYPSAAIAEPGKRRVAFGRAVERAHGIKE